MYSYWILKSLLYKVPTLDFPEGTERCAAIASRLVLTVRDMLKMKTLLEQQKREEGGKERKR